MGRKKFNSIKKEGRLFVHPDGYGFVATDMSKDVFIPKKHINGARHGDKVLIRAKSKGELYEGEVLKILERKVKDIVGMVQKEQGRFMFFPLDKHFPFAVPVQKGTKNIKDEDVVTCEILEAKHGNMYVKLNEVLGDEHSPDIDAKLVIKKNGLPFEFSKKAKEKVSSLRYGINASERFKRHDLTNMQIVTIDGENARDFDDAVFVKKASHGYSLYVSIADVSHYVKFSDPVDSDAYERGTSVYFPDRAIPMLPEELSNDLCSLIPHKERVTLTAEISYDNNGIRTGYDVYQSIIKSYARLTYTSVKEMLENSGDDTYKDHQLIRNLLTMKELALKLKQNRIAQGSLDLDLPEVELLIGLSGDIESIVKRERNVAHIIIEEFMLEANRVVAIMGTSTKHSFLYRVHDQPDREKLYEFYLFAYNLGIKLPVFESFDALSLQHILDEVKNTKHEKVINYTLLRSMKQAKYSTHNIGHYGLGFDLYTHFTSPIRRYPDLTVHRIIKNKLANNKESSRELFGQALLDTIANNTSETERRAMDAERDITKLLISKALKEMQDDIFTGYISGITKSGLFVEIENYFIDGFLSFDNIKGDYFYSDIQRYTAIGKRTGRMFKIGQKIKIEIEHIERFTGNITLRLAQNK